MKKIVFSLVTLVMFGTSVCIGKTSKEVTKELPREEQQVQVRKSTKQQNVERRNPRKDMEPVRRDEKKPQDAPIRKEEITISMQTLHF